MKTILVFLILATPAAAQPNIRLAGPDTGEVGRPLVFIVHGLPELDWDKPLGEQLAFVRLLGLRLNSPEGCEASLDDELTISVATLSWRLRVTFVASVPGVYVIGCAWHQEPYFLGLHRVTVGGSPEPDPTPDPTPKQWLLMMVYDSDRLDNYPEPQRRLLISRAVREDLTARGHQLLRIVEVGALALNVGGDWELWFTEARGKPVPGILFVPHGGGRFHYHPMPNSFDELLRLMETL